MATAEVDHPLFARFWRGLTRVEPRAVRDRRRELLAGLSGRVIEVGAGSGTNFPFYPGEVTEVLAVEPEPYLRELALEAAARAPVPVTVVDGVADALPAPDGAFDAAVASLVLCSVPDQGRALAELRRVLRSGGELRYLEHVRADTPLLARTQRLVDRLFWPRAFGGCHTHRDTGTAIATAGFQVERQQAIRMSPGVVPTAPGIIGSARKI